jgi:hypothetical protein
VIDDRYDFLSNDNKVFIRVIAAYKGMAEEEFVNEVLDLIRKHNEFRFEYEEKIT